MENTLISNLFAKATEEEKALILKVLSSKAADKDQALSDLNKLAKEKEVIVDVVNTEEVEAPESKSGVVKTAAIAGGVVLAGVAAYMLYTKFGKKAASVVTGTEEAPAE
ncbi:hypothetical protein [Proteus columbae]|uniref:hypothetical protein n=1 Tax=Proteus columbae TaxID=1987580 RepID=UPI00288A9855|nr:hypothetical protein [Proteus columbae]